MYESIGKMFLAALQSGVIEAAQMLLARIGVEMQNEAEAVEVDGE